MRKVGIAGGMNVRSDYMTYRMMFEVLDMLMNESKLRQVTFCGPDIAIEYLGNKEDYTGKGQREIYRIERRVE